MQQEMVVLVSENDVEVGVMEKMEAHKTGVLHRAFSIFIFNDKGQLLIQKRASVKYHSPALWTNTCCGHPRPSENIDIAAKRRLNEELGINTELIPWFHFLYKVKFSENLYENEYDHVFYGFYNGSFNVNKDEVDSIDWINFNELDSKVKANPDAFTHWFKLIYNRINELPFAT